MLKYAHLDLPDRAHQIGCPAKRLESYEAFRPKRALDDSGAIVTVQETLVVCRCMDCGGELARTLDEVDALRPADAGEEPTDAS